MAHRNVALVYHFFAHYRQPVLEELLEKSKHHFLLCADTNNALILQGREVFCSRRVYTRLKGRGCPAIFAFSTIRSRSARPT